MSLQVLRSISGFSGMEFATFKLKQGVSEANMLEAAQLADLKFLSIQEGFLGHIILKSKDGIYADLTFAVTQKMAEDICAKWIDNIFTCKYIEFIDSDSVNMSFWARIK